MNKADVVESQQKCFCRYFAAEALLLFVVIANNNDTRGSEPDH